MYSSVGLSLAFLSSTVSSMIVLSRLYTSGVLYPDVSYLSWNFSQAWFWLCILSWYILLNTSFRCPGNKRFPGNNKTQTPLLFSFPVPGVFTSYYHVPCNSTLQQKVFIRSFLRCISMLLDEEIPLNITCSLGVKDATNDSWLKSLIRRYFPSKIGELY